MGPSACTGNDHKFVDSGRSPIARTTTAIAPEPVIPGAQ